MYCVLSLGVYGTHEVCVLHKNNNKISVADCWYCEVKFLREVTKSPAS